MSIAYLSTGTASAGGARRSSFGAVTQQTRPYFRVADNSLGKPLGLPCRSSVGCLALLLMYGCSRSTKAMILIILSLVAGLIARYPFVAAARWLFVFRLGR